MAAIIILIALIYYLIREFSSNQPGDPTESSRSINYLADKKPITTVESEKD